MNTDIYEYTANITLPEPAPLPKPTDLAGWLAGSMPERIPLSPQASVLKRFNEIMVALGIKPHAVLCSPNDHTAYWVITLGVMAAWAPTFMLEGVITAKEDELLQKVSREFTDVIVPRLMARQAKATPYTALFNKLTNQPAQF